MFMAFNLLGAVLLCIVRRLNARGAIMAACGALS
jgi:hypothetical protein